MVVRDHPFLHLLSQVIRPGIFICRDENVISDMQNITKAEVIYSLTKGRGQFADLATLAEVELIDPAFASGERDGCLFVLKAEAMPGRRAGMRCQQSQKAQMSCEPAITHSTQMKQSALKYMSWREPNSPGLRWRIVSRKWDCRLEQLGSRLNNNGIDRSRAYESRLRFAQYYARGPVIPTVRATGEIL